jgi:hypothetical protein
MTRGFALLRGLESHGLEYDEKIEIYPHLLVVTMIENQLYLRIVMKNF